MDHHAKAKTWMVSFLPPEEANQKRPPHFIDASFASINVINAIRPPGPLSCFFVAGCVPQREEQRMDHFVNTTNLMIWICQRLKKQSRSPPPIQKCLLCWFQCSPEPKVHFRGYCCHRCIETNGQGHGPLCKGKTLGEPKSEDEFASCFKL